MKWLLTLVFALGCFGCGDPCKDLSNQICSCERTPADQQACMNKVNTLAGQWQKSSDARKERAGRDACAALIEGCTCDALATGNLKACGLSAE